MSRKALFFDIDGTLLSEVNRQVPESARAALAKTRSLGNLVFVNTGRAYGALGPVREVVTADGWLCGCGTYIEAEGQVLYHRVIPKEQALALVQEAEDCDIDMIMEGKDGCYFCSENSRLAQGQQIREFMAFSIRSCRWKEDGGDFEKFCILTDGQSDKVRFFRSMGLDIDIMDRGNGFYECVPAGYSKASAVDIILAHYDIPLRDAYVFGDSCNDLSMFEHVPNAILMGKHDKVLEPYASFWTKTVEQDGVAYAMGKLGLLG